MVFSELIATVKTNLLLYILLFVGGAFVYFAILLGQRISPTYLWLLVPGTGFSVLGYLEYRRLQKTKLLTRLREEWGVKHLEKDRDFPEISDLFMKDLKSRAALDDRTWNDLNMNDVFSRLDRTFTWPGVQRLYQMLRLPEIDKMSILEERSAVIAEFEENAKSREAVQVILNRMDSRIGSGLCALLWKTPEIDPIHPLFLYRLMSVVALLSPLLFFLGARYSVVILLIFQFNMYLHFKVQKQIRSHFEGVRSLRQLIGISKRLARVDVRFSDELQLELKEALGEVRQFNKIVRFVGIESSDPFLHIFEQYFTIFFLAEVRGFYRALEFIGENCEALKTLFLAVGEVDALQSVASYRASLPSYCEPDFIQKRSLRLEGAYHPLLEDPVPNSITASARGILITGSNMSGKSTFLRTVGLNVLFAQTIATCTSQVYQACPVWLLTSIGRSDNVVEGRSYYLDEAINVLRILESLSDEVVTCVIFDELYRGTNSEERIFASQRVLEYLVKRNSLVFVATHDLELTELLTSGYESLHFSELVGEMGLEFDYKLKKGPATTRNAIALLRYLNYPKEITDESSV